MYILKHCGVTLQDLFLVPVLCHHVVLQAIQLPLWTMEGRH